MAACSTYGPCAPLSASARPSAAKPRPIRTSSQPALCDGRLREQERARDLVGGQTSEQAERERDARLAGENWMTGDEHQAQEVVADVIVDRGIEVRHGHLLLGLHLLTELFVLALQPLASAQQVDRMMLSGGHQPGARVVRDA